MINGTKNTIFKLLFSFLAIAFLAPFSQLMSDGISTQNTDKSEMLKFAPTCFKSDTLLKRTAYFASYSFAHGQSEWVLYNLRKEHLFGDEKRKNNFKADPDLNNAISSQIFTKSGYDRGHLAPAADFSWSQQAMVESFYMSNISPQLPGFNRGIWKKLEDKVRTWAYEKQDLLIIVGPILNDTLKKLKDRVSIPAIFYKIILDKKQNEAIAFLMKNESSNFPLHNFAVSVDSVEKLSGLDFFFQQDSLWQQNVECCVDLEKWPLE
ncbi:MAG: DNA/RNA non-specific endonuclease [Bacteroidia bacterium]